MPLHRDIHWIGRQWAVTGHGMQLIDQKLQGFFDIEVARLWDDILIDSMCGKEWLNRADFDKALALARSRYQQPARAEAPFRQAAPVAAVEAEAPSAPAVKPFEPKLEPSRLETKPTPPPVPKAAVVEPSQVIAAVSESPTVVTSSPPVVKPPETKREAPKLESPTPTAHAIPNPASPEPPRDELKAFASVPVEPPAVARPPQQPAPPAIEPTAPVVKPADAKRSTLKLNSPEPVTVTLVKRRPVEAPAAAPPRLQISSNSAVVSAAAAVPPAPRPPAIERDAPERVVFVKPGVIEKLGAVAAPAAPTAGTKESSEVEPSPSRSLYRMSYEGRARFVRPWRVVARKI